MTSSDFDRAFEDLLHGRGPAWQVVGTDRCRLVAACIDYLTPERVSAYDFSNPGPGRAAWTLDRLLPLSETGLFRRLNSYERWLYTLYPLFRRSPEDMDSVTPERFGRGEHSAVEAAWVETRAADDDLLGWHAECLRRGWPAECTHFPPLAVVDYCRRAPELDRLVSRLKEAPPREAPVILHCLMRLVASSMPRTAAPESGLVARLRQAGFGAVADAVAGKMEPDPTPRAMETGTFTLRIDLDSHHPDPSLWESSLAEVLWTEQQGPDDADRLATGRRVYALPRLARIVPAHRADIWERMLARHAYADPSLIEAFCGWCMPAHRHLLPPHFAHENLEWASCAFETYLALAPREEAARLADDPARPAWQIESLDRWMHAPPELRPPRQRVRGPCEIVFDLRECDPFDVRYKERA